MRLTLIYALRLVGLGASRPSEGLYFFCKSLEVLDPPGGPLGYPGDHLAEETPLTCGLPGQPLGLALCWRVGRFGIDPSGSNPRDP